MRLIKTNEDQQADVTVEAEAPARGLGGKRLSPTKGSTTPSGQAPSAEL